MLNKKISEKLIHTLDLKIFQNFSTRWHRFDQFHAMGFSHFESHLSKLTSLWDVTTTHRKHVNHFIFSITNYFSVLQTLQ
jgi:hypothetical protein